VLDATFWNSPYTIRYSINEHGYGFDAIHRHREARVRPGCAFPISAGRWSVPMSQPSMTHRCSISP
jgi:hypothetical protein